MMSEMAMFQQLRANLVRDSSPVGGPMVAQQAV
jgi:hypothetical protein